MTILFAMKHEKPDLMELGLETMQSLNTLVVTSPDIASVFFERFYVQVVRDLLTLMTDYRHVSGFKLQGQILQQLIQVADCPAVAQKRFLVDLNGNPHQFNSNKEFVIALLIDCISTLFPYLNKVQIEAFVLKLFNFCADWPKFKETLRDLLISMKQHSSSNDEFYQDEKTVRPLVSFT